MKYWLMKAEPNSRIEKGKDVKFSVDDFESVGTTAWEGVRNHEAKKLMQSMKVGDQVLFYHSNCKNPGVAGFAEISKEAYPDYTAWDPEHPYYDAKSDKDKPRWFIVDVTFKARATHLVPLSLFKRLANESSDKPPADVSYIGKEGIQAIKEMALIKRGRLSVQPVEEDAWKAVQPLAEKGGWEEEAPIATDNSVTDKGRKRGRKPTKISEDMPKSKKMKTKGRARGRVGESKADDDTEQNEEDAKLDSIETRLQKNRKAEAADGNEDNDAPSSTRRSTRNGR